MALFLPSSLVNLGLDLRGGAHLLAEVQVSDVYEQRMAALWPDVRVYCELREVKLVLLGYKKESRTN